MTKKIGISLKDELYEWASREVEEGRAESVSALIAEGLAVLEAGSRLEALVAGLRAETGEPDEQTKERIAEALRAANEAYRRHLAPKATSLRPNGPSRSASRSARRPIQTSSMCTWRWLLRNGGTRCSPPTTQTSPGSTGILY